MGITFTWLGHSTFLFMIDEHAVLIDPFLTNNPLAPVSADSLNPEVILLTHGHGDHIGDVVSIAQRTGAPVICNPEISRWLRGQGVQHTISGNSGGTYRGEFMDVRWTIAHHSSSLPDGSYGGSPHGFVISASGIKLYYAGDTDIFLDMQLIGDMGIDVAFLPIGDTYTMGIKDSIKAINLIRPRAVVPMHYNTFGAIVQDAATWAERVNIETRAVPVVLDPGGEYRME